jgi:hypothetical protein
MSSVPPEHIFTMQYFPTDFFYSTNGKDLPQGFEGCTILKEENDGNIICKEVNTNSEMNSVEIYKCYQAELCKNQSLVNNLYNIRDQHSTSNQRYGNVKNKYTFEVVKTVNLLIGIVVGILFIRMNNKASG